MPLLSVKIDDRIAQALAIVLNPEVLEMILDTIAAAARAEWVRLAQRELHSSRESYVRGIQEVDAMPRVRVIALTGWLANAVESGHEAYDLRETLLGPGSHVRRLAKHGGYYARIPFRHGTPGSQGAAGTPMGSSYGPVRPGSRRAGNVLEPLEVKALGKAVYAAAKQLRPSGGPGGILQRGDRLPAGMAPLLRGPDPSHPDPRMRRGHRTDIYAGMIKERHTYEKATQTQYMTFRTISTRVQNGWIHPGIQAHNLADKVKAFVARIVPATVKQIVEQALPVRGFPGEQRGGKPL
jgi:hypothetical protein